MPSSRALVPVVFAALLWGTPAVRAELVSFSYSLTLGDTTGYGVSATPSADQTSVTYHYGGATATLAVALPGTATATPGGASFHDAVGTPIEVATLSGVLLPRSVSYLFVRTTLNLHLTDGASGESGVTHLMANLEGWNDPASGTGSLFASTGGIADPLVLGGHTYTFIAFAQEHAWPTTTEGQAGVIVRVYVDRPAYDRLGPMTLPGPALIATGPIPTPEPSSLALAGAGAALLGGWVLRGRRPLQRRRGCVR